MSCPGLGTVKLFAFARHGGMHVMDLPAGCVPDLVRALQAAVRSAPTLDGETGWMGACG